MAGKFNIAATNRSSVVSGLLPAFDILKHVGRKSGKVYRTPVNVFRARNGLIITLTCSSQSEWVKNLLACRRVGTQDSREEISAFQAERCA
jgi:deazaflavin-dependent oxidoreductase (nitroreductase family)